MTQAFPLQWPQGRPRKHPAHRKRAKFGKDAHNGRWTQKRELTVADALARLQRELDMIGARYPVVSSNVELRLDGVASVSEMFAGFEALPAPGQAQSQQWWVVLGLDRSSATIADVKAAYRRLAAERHPDKPG
ncbi:MAG: hypothetical protein Kow0026_08360 [Oricola sp.]